MNKKLSDDMQLSYVEQDGVKIFSIIIQSGYREAKSINIIDDEINELYQFLKNEAGADE